MARLMPYAPEPAALTQLADGTIKQISPFTGTEVWTVPGRGNRPISHPVQQVRPLTEHDRTSSCAFCCDRYLETPPEKERVVARGGEAASGGVAPSAFERLDGVPASRLFDTVAEFRRVPNLFEILTFDYWHANHGYEVPDAARERMEAYLAEPEGAAHVAAVARTKLRASGQDPELWESMGPAEQRRYLAAFFAGGHDVIVARRHFTDSATDTSALAGSGTLTPAEHRAYTRLAVHSAQSLYEANRWVRYVAVFQNWLRPAGASFDHLHKQLVGIDERGVVNELELARVRANPNLYNEMGVDYAAYHGLLVASNEHAVAFAGFGHRYPSLEVYSTSATCEPWLMSREEVDAVSDLLHALHAATGADVPSNEEWHHKPLDVDQPMPWHVTLKWRVSTLAGFEGGTKIYLNTIDPWSLRERVVARLEDLRADRLISPMAVGDECPTTPNRLLYNPVLSR
ncbi:DUF4921 family protein [Actinomyces urogenitalis]|uniref:DUF4921 family protein n=1 Tax=Actinomyces urogenitalis TaxID=103621 RepID=UPI0029034E50|nr:DUF4921 family protein [Actinomyces urogenitalis]MDU0863968.1 DUF4921 family protein [Actinomyces urogenitalis]MDU0874695.1 DUF4921 family protein [Actinomyces urogenitalis]MDU1564353.1 DUF4921 family protein [Actinomyces urogenitalis]MDU1639669.1 DUF4921 family protein [Actinomyces urogenitalis]MDU6777478.1 DUF4921 family protein [Actinomyces urogenitalis]